MIIGNGNAFGDMLLNSKGTCPGCHRELTFGEAGRLARDHGITDNVVACPGCGHVFEVNLVPGRMTLTRDVTASYPRIKAEKKGGLLGKLFGRKA